MAMELRQVLKLSQQLVMTPQLQLSIKLLQLSRLELVDYVKEELEQNPVLEETSDIGDSERGETDDGKGKKEEGEAKAEGDNEEAVFDYLADSPSGSLSNRSQISKETEMPSVDAYLSDETTLIDHLLWQLHLSKFDQDELEIGEFIIGNIGDDGYLTSTLEEISEEFDLSDEVVEKVLKKVQKFDPIGIAGRDVKECLLIQAGFLSPSNPLVTEIIDCCLPLLETKDYHAISKKLDVSDEAVVEAVKTILELEPKPGRAFSTSTVHYVVPDVFVKFEEDEFVVSLNDSGLPKLRISYHYRTMLRDNNDLSMDTKGYLQQRLRSALWLIKSIHQRQKTLLKITECIVDFQGDFLRKGIGHLKPLILRDVADKVEVHESTVSRVTTNKYAYTPQGIFELKYFFNKGISNANGECIASETIKEKIKKIVSSEDPVKPLTDESIVRILRRSDIEIARRTVAKYREMVGVLPSSKRRKRSQ